MEKHDDMVEKAFPVLKLKKVLTAKVVRTWNFKKALIHCIKYMIIVPFKKEVLFCRNWSLLSFHAQKRIQHQQKKLPCCIWNELAFDLKKKVKGIDRRRNTNSIWCDSFYNRFKKKSNFPRFPFRLSAKLMIQETLHLDTLKQLTINVT